MLLYDPITYLREILKRYPNSYLAEDEVQAIIGINCEYIYGDDLSKLEFATKGREKICEFAGLFGIASWNMTRKFENTGDVKPAPYEFPTYFYADAKAYLHYDKQSKIYSFYGSGEYFSKLEYVSEDISEKKELFYEMITNLDAEKSHFLNAVEKAKNYIKSGDIFQVVLGEILHLRSNLDALNFYEILKTQNPSQYMYYFPTPFGTISGSSPELVMQIKKGEIFVAPIAGTRARGNDANEDERLKNELLSDEKELAEHRMLVDLARNDVGKFAKCGSIKVKNLAHIEKFESVMHIVSEVYGEKRDDKGALDVFSVVFPAGTLSGSPKIRAMQIINELESSGRGIYGGALGFWHFNGDAQQAILIRSAIFVNSDVNSHVNLDVNSRVSDVFIGAGAGIVWDSQAQNEYAEIQNKRRSCVKIFEENCKEKR